MVKNINVGWGVVGVRTFLKKKLQRFQLGYASTLSRQTNLE